MQGFSTMPDSVSILKDLVAINSENPGGSECEIASFCSCLLSRYGIETENLAADPRRPNVIARLEGRASRKIIFQSHLDTKPAFHAGCSHDDWTRPPFVPTVEDGLLYGLGACDTKGGAAAQLAALIACAQTWTGDGPTLEWQGVADEENGSTYGAEFLCGIGALKADFAVVAEPTLGRVSLEQMGSIWVDVEITGLQCHGGMPWLGRDAIDAALQIIQEMKSRVAAKQRRSDIRHHPQVGVRILSGGGHAGTVAGRCQLVSDIRVPPGEDRNDYLALWHEAAAAVMNACGVEIRIGMATGGGCEPHALTDKGLVAGVTEAWGEVFGEPLAPHMFYGGSDARYFARACTPAIVFGAGNLAQAHAPDEFAPIADIVRCEQFLKSLPGILARRWG